MIWGNISQYLGMIAQNHLGKIFWNFMLISSIKQFCGIIEDGIILNTLAIVRPSLEMRVL